MLKGTKQFTSRALFHPSGEETRVKWVASCLLTATNEAIVVRIDALTAGNVPKIHNNTLALSGLSTLRLVAQCHAIPYFVMNGWNTRVLT